MGCAVLDSASVCVRCSRIMEAIYLKELRSYSISEVMNFRDKHVELVNRLAQSDRSESDAEMKKKRAMARSSTKEKVAKNSANLERKNRSRKKKSKSEHETAPVLPLVIPEEYLKKTFKKSDLDLIPGKDVVFVFKVYPPYTYEPHNRSNRLKHNMEIAILGHQTLNLLCDKIICDDMLMEVGGDISETPDVPVRQRLGEKYKSRMLYIGNNFYVDKSDDNNIDYSATIRNWGSRNEIYFGDTLDMHQTACLDLVARIGYPYVYQHLGGCEHILRIEYARLLDERDCLESKLYPFYSYVARNNNLKICMACMELSQWIVMDSPRMIANPSFLCDSCFRSYHYIDGKKIGNFKAVRYWDCKIFGNAIDVSRGEKDDGGTFDEDDPPAVS